MGAIAEAMVAYAQPLIDETDGSLDQMNRALAIAQLCWNLALFPEKERDETLARMRPTLMMDDAEFEAFRRSVVLPMIRRQHEMFHTSRLGPMDRSGKDSAAQTRPSAMLPTKKYPGTGRNARCPCGSGKKYKSCCGR